MTFLKPLIRIPAQSADILAVRESALLAFSLPECTWQCLERGAAGFTPPSALAEARGIDAVLVETDGLWIADNAGGRLLFYPLVNGMVSAHPARRVSLPAAAGITAMTRFAGQYVLLDRDHGLLRCWPGAGEAMREVGQRLGLAAGGRAGRLGFEYPGDMLAGKECLWICDSGNRRVLALDERFQVRGEWSMPGFPRLFLGMSAEHLLVLDWDDRVWCVSEPWGVWGGEKAPASVAAGIAAGEGRAWVIAEDGSVAQWALTPPEPLEWARQNDRPEPLGRWLARLGRGAELRALLARHPGLTPVCAPLFPDDGLDDVFSAYFHERWREIVTETGRLRPLIADDAREFLTHYLALAGGGDHEACQIRKEIAVHHLFAHLREFRRRLQEVRNLRGAFAGRRAVQETADACLRGRRPETALELERCTRRLQGVRRPLDEAAVLDDIVAYGLAREEARILFPDLAGAFPAFFQDKFLIAVLSDFYCALARLLQAAGDQRGYEEYCELELRRFPDKTAVFTAYIQDLLNRGEFRRALDLFASFPFRDKEDMNALQSRVHQAMGDEVRAFACLLREVELHPDKIEYIPPLLAMRRLDEARSAALLQRLEQRAGRTVDIYLGLAEAFLARGDRAAALAYVEKELSAYPDNPRALKMKVALLAGDPARADRVSTVLPLVQGGHWETHLLLGRACYAAGDAAGCWRNLRLCLLGQPPAAAFTPFVWLFACLGRLGSDGEAAAEARETAAACTIPEVRRELEGFVALAEDPACDRRPPAEYLGLYSTRRSAHDRLLARIESAWREKNRDGALDLAEIVLAAFPGDPPLMALLDRFRGEMTETLHE